MYILGRVKHGNINKVRHQLGNIDSCVYTQKLLARKIYFSVFYSINDEIILIYLFQMSRTTGSKYLVRLNLHSHIFCSFKIDWFLANIGGLTGVVGGFSLIGFTEIFYFSLKQILMLIFKKFKIKFKSSDLQIYP